MNPKPSTPRTFTTRINQNGRIVIPAALRDQLGLKAGESVIMRLENGVLQIEAHRTHILKIQNDFSRKAPPDAKLHSQQLIEDREEEATSEMEQWLG